MVLAVGGGFGALIAVRGLAGAFDGGQEVDTTLLDRVNYPRLPSTGARAPSTSCRVYHRRCARIMQTFCTNIPRVIMQRVERQYGPERHVGRGLMKEWHRRPEGARAGRGGLSRWPATIALLIVGALYAAISGALTFGPRAFLLALVSVLLVPLMSAHQKGHHRLARWLGLGLVSLAGERSNGP
jgi:hypothetical protein